MFSRLMPTVVRRPNKTGDDCATRLIDNRKPYYVLTQELVPESGSLRRALKHKVRMWANSTDRLNLWLGSVGLAHKAISENSYGENTATERRTFL
jgi:hypothetical protein